MDNSLAKSNSNSIIICDKEKDEVNKSFNKILVESNTFRNDLKEKRKHNLSCYFKKNSLMIESRFKPNSKLSLPGLDQ